MKSIRHFFIVILFIIQNSFLLNAQTTEGKEFWVTFGQIATSSMGPSLVDFFDFHIRIVGGNEPTSGTIYFTNLKTSVHYNIDPYEVYGYSLENDEKYAVYTTVTGVTDFSVRITASNPVSVYASKKGSNNYVDVTNLLPVTTFGTEYYAISYNTSSSNNEAYSVVATQNNTQLYHNGDSVATLNTGEVYYRTSNVDMTGTLIKANRPVAFLAQNKSTAIGGGYSDILFQQLAPVHTWGKTFFVPVTVIGTEFVRIVVSQDNTTITQTGGTIRTQMGGQPTLENLQAGQFVELEITLINNGCFIQADKPIGVCSYMRSYSLNYNPTGGSGSQVWIPPIEQSISNVLTASFPQPYLPYHYALVVTPTDTRDNTMVSIEGGILLPLSNGSWYANGAAGMSFYNFPLTNLSASYIFSNPEKIIVLGYGIGNIGARRSYYYLAGSAMRNLSAAFTANNIPNNELSNHIFCEHDITFVANVEGIHPNPGRIKWYIDGIEEETKRDSLEWSKNFATGNYAIKMSVLFENDSTKTYEDTLRIANCEAVFYANNVHSENLQDTVFCAKDVYFRAEVENYTEIKWYIDSVEYVPDNPLEWSKSFETGTYNIEMWVRFANGEETVPPISNILRMEVFWVKIKNVRY